MIPGSSCGVLSQRAVRGRVGGSISRGRGGDISAYLCETLGVLAVC